MLTSPLPLAQLAPELPLPGPHQRRNAALAVATVRVLAPVLPVSPPALARGLAAVRWPGRMQVERLPGHRTLVLDGAHNPDGAAALRAAFEQAFPGTRPALLLGVLADKDWPEMVKTLAPLAGRVVLVPVQSPRALDPAKLQASCAEVCPGTPAVVAATVSEAFHLLNQEPLILVAGSLYLIGEVMEHLRLSPAPPVPERRMNEWTARPR